MEVIMKVKILSGTLAALVLLWATPGVADEKAKVAQTEKDQQQSLQLLPKMIMVKVKEAKDGQQSAEIYQVDTAQRIDDDQTAQKVVRQAEQGEPMEIVPGISTEGAPAAVQKLFEQHEGRQNFGRWHHYRGYFPHYGVYGYGYTPYYGYPSSYGYYYGGYTYPYTYSPYTYSSYPYSYHYYYNPYYYPH